MAKAKTRDSTPPLNTSANSVTNTDPVVALSDQLLDLWNADDASELHYSEEALKIAGKEIQNQIIEWRAAVTMMISFTQATSLAGALVQLAIMLDEFDSLVSLVEPELGPELRKRHNLHEFRITRLVKSAMRAVRESLRESDLESVRALASIYPDGSDNWLDCMPRWAAEGRAEREKRE